MTATVTPYRSDVEPGRDRFDAVLRAEWTKFRTVRSWVIGVVAAAIVTVLLGLVAASGSHTVVAAPPGAPPRPAVPIGPGGEVVNDSFYFVHQPLAGDGTITVRVTSFTGGTITDDGAAGGASAGGTAPSVTGSIAPWAKAGLIIKANTTPGSAYAAVMVTGDHGVRMQYNYTNDEAGPPVSVSSSAPRWLRLVRAGEDVTGYASADGTQWTKVGTAHLSGLGSTVQAGLFVTSPAEQVVEEHFGGGTGEMLQTEATAAFDTVDLQGQWPAGNWTNGAVGGDPTRSDNGGLESANGVFTIRGSGNIAPQTGADSPGRLDHMLVGAFAGLIVLIVVSVLFITAEHRRGMIRTTLSATPRRGRVLAAKAAVLGAVTFVIGLIATVIVIPPARHILRANGNFVLPVPFPTEVRVVVGTAALMAIAAVFAMSVGSILRRSVGAASAAIVLIVLPYLFATAGVLPATAADWVLRISPAAGFAIQQVLPAYHQVDDIYTPAMGYYPLSPFAGFAVLCAWTASAIGLAVYLQRRRDA